MRFTKRERVSWWQLFKCLLGRHTWRQRVVSEHYQYRYCTHCLERL